MKIMFINNEGSGFADYIDVTEGKTVAQLFVEQMIGHKPENFMIRVNRQVATRDQVLVEGDRVSITPVKIHGAIAA